MFWPKSPAVERQIGGNQLSGPKSFELEPEGMSTTCPALARPSFFHPQAGQGHARGAAASGAEAEAFSGGLKSVESTLLLLG